MSEYQYYEFLAIDRPLDARAQDAVRSLSTRARITATSFVNEYHWGNFSGNPRLMVERYYDAHLYLANWGSRHVMLRLPENVVDLSDVEEYCVGEYVDAWTAGDYLVLGLTSEDDQGEWDYEPNSSLGAIVGVRAELAAGDRRPLYLAWLAGYGTWERDEYAFDPVDDDELEPPVPPGLHTLTAAQREMADFLRLDDELLAVAAEASPPLNEPTSDATRLTDWVKQLSPDDKDALLLRVVRDQPAAAQMEMLRRFRNDTATHDDDCSSRRSVGDLLDAAARRRAERLRKERAKQAEEEARREQQRALARERRLDQLARDEEGAWSRVDALIATRKPSDYDAAVALLTELRALAEREVRTGEFARRAGALRQHHARKPTLIERLTRAGL